MATGKAATEPRVILPRHRIVVTDNGGFPVDNIAYWKMARTSPQMTATPDGALVTKEGQEKLIVHFKTGGFIWIDDMDAVQFGSLVYGEPF